MKRHLAFIILLFTMTIAYTQSYDNFVFTLGTSYVEDKVTPTSSSGTMFGLDYMFQNNFSGGVKFFTINPANFMAVNISYRTKQDVIFSVYTGADANKDTIFGMGLGYDFFVNKNSTFTSLGLYMDWIGGAPTTSSFNIEDGGVFMIGLRAGMGK